MATLAIPVAEEAIPVVTSTAATALPTIGKYGSKALPAIKQVGQSIETKVLPVAQNVESKIAQNIPQALEKEPGKLRKMGETLFYSGLLPGAGFTIAGNLLSSSSSTANPQITNGDLVNAHKKANGDINKLKNHKFDNGQSFRDVQKNYIVKHQDKLNEAHKNVGKLYTSKGKPTKINKQAMLHGINLH